MTALFHTGAFTLHSGEESNSKIECDLLTDEGTTKPEKEDRKEDFARHTRWIWDFCQDTAKNKETRL